MPEPGVDVAWGPLNRAWRKAGYEELWVQFRPRGSKDVLDAILDAAQVANEVEDAGWGDDVHTGGISESDAGPVVLLRRAEHEPGLCTWLGAFAHHLQSLGKAGKVTAAPYANFPAGSLPSWFTGALRPSMQLTAFVSYQTNDLSQLEEHERRGVWHVPVALTEKVTDAAADVSPGGCCYQVMDDTMSWQDRLERVTAAMVAFPEDTDLAFVRHSSFRTFTWSALQTGRPPLPFVEEHRIRYNKHLPPGTNSVRHSFVCKQFHH